MQLPDSAWPRLFGVGLLITVLSMPFLNLGMSIGGIWLSSTWLAYFLHQGIYKSDWTSSIKAIYSNKIALLLIGLFALHLLGMIYTEDEKQGMKDVLIKLPLLVMPFTFAGMPDNVRGLKRTIENLFVFAVLMAAVILITNFFLNNNSYSDSREAHVFISHIRYGLMVALAFGILLQRAFESGNQKKSLLPLMLIGVLGFYMVYMQNLTGIICSGVVAIIAVLIFPGNLNKSYKKAIRIGTISLLFLAVYLISKKVSDYFPDSIPQKGDLELYSADGTMYDHNYGDSQVENGNLVWYYIAWPELEETWDSLSSFPFDGKDQMGQPMYATIIRYMSSKGLRKDREGIEQLLSTDIAAIERGVTNSEDESRSRQEFRMQQILFEVNAYLNGENPSGNSIIQRFEFWKTGVYIVKQNPVFGVGTGDLKTEFAKAYEARKSNLDSRYRHRSHNQFMSICIAFGFVGLIYFVVTILSVFIVKKQETRYFPFIAFFSIIILSFLTEDTLETQAGVTFFAYFMSLYLFFPTCKSSNFSATCSTAISKDSPAEG